MWRFSEITSETDRNYGILLLGFIPIASTFKCNLIANNRGFQRFRPSDICLPDDPIIILIVHGYRPIHGRAYCSRKSIGNNESENPISQHRFDAAQERITSLETAGDGDFENRQKLKTKQEHKNVYNRYE